MILNENLYKTLIVERNILYKIYKHIISYESIIPQEK